MTDKPNGIKPPDVAAIKSEGKVLVRGFADFIREQGVVGLAVGFILGGAVSKLVASLVTDIINPLVGAMFKTGEIKSEVLKVGHAKVMWGNFVSTGIDFVIVAAVVYIGVKKLGLDKLDKKKPA